jgi:hypothetical protein
MTFGIAWSGVLSGNVMLSELKLGNICEDARPPAAPGPNFLPVDISTVKPHSENGMEWGRPGSLQISYLQLLVQLASQSLQLLCQKYWGFLEWAAMGNLQLLVYLNFTL